MARGVIDHNIAHDLLQILVMGYVFVSEYQERHKCYECEKNLENHSDNVVVIHWKEFCPENSSLVRYFILIQEITENAKDTKRYEKADID